YLSQREALHQRLLEARRKKLTEADAEAAQPQRSLAAKVDTGSITDPDSFLDEFERALAETSRFKNEATTELDDSECRQLDQLRRDLAKTKDDEEAKVDEAAIKQLGLAATDEELQRMLADHRHQTDRFRREKRAERKRQAMRLEEKLSERQARLAAAKEAEEAELNSVKRNQEVVLRKALVYQVDLDENTRRQILEEHDRNMQAVTNNLHLSRHKQEASLEAKLAQRRAEADRLKKEAHDARLAIDDERRGDLDKLDAELNRKLDENKKQLELERRNGLAQIRDEMARETESALRAQETHMSAVIGRLQTGRARRHAAITEQEKVLKELEIQLQDGLKGRLRSGDVQGLDQVLQSYNNQVAAMERQLDHERRHQDRQLTEELQRRKLDRRDRVQEEVDKEEDKSIKALKASGHGRMAKFVMDSVLDTKYRNSMLEINEEMRMELRKEQELLDREMEDELKAELDKQREHLFGQLTALTDLSPDEVKEMVDKAAKSAGAGKRLTRKMTNEFVSIVQESRTKPNSSWQIRMEERDEKSNDASLLPPKFSGQSNVHFWLSIFEDFAEDKNWDDAKRASKVKLLLRGEAQVCVWDMPDADKKSYEKIKALLLQQYGGSANQHRAMQEFQGRQRKNGESIRELSFALRLLYMGARPDDPSTLRDREVKFRIIQLLSAGIREALLKESDSDTCTLGTLVERATRLEQVMSKNTPASSSMVSVVDDRLSRLEQQLETLTAAVTSGAARGGRAGPGDRRQAQRTSGCYQCGKDGHIARRCPTKGAHKQGRCFNCSGWGHNAATAHSVFVRALLQEKPVCFLLDTGAQTSLISHSLMRSCGLQLESGSSCCPTSVDGSRLQCLGTARGTVQVGETTRLDHVFNVVEGISVDLILGMDFIGRATSELRININNKTVFFNDEAVPFFTNSSKIQMVTGTLVARIECNINVPARSEKLVWLRVKSKDEQGVFEPNAEFTQETGLLASRVLALSADQRIPVLMCNLGSEAVTLYANKAVGEFEAADVLEPVGNVKEKLKNWDVNPELTELERDKLMTILKANDDLFSTHEFDLGSTSRDALLQSVFKALTEGREHLSNSGQQKVEEFLGDDGIEIGPHGALLPHTNSGASDTLEYVEDVQKRLLQSRRLVHQKLQSAQTERNERYNKDVRFQPYNQGDLVMLSCKTVKPGRSKSLSNRWTGPYVVLKRLGEVNYRVRLAPGLAVRRRRKLVVHHDRLKPFVKRRGSLQLTDEQQPAPATSTSPEQLGVPDAWAQLSGGNDDDDGDTEAAIDPVVPPALRRSIIYHSKPAFEADGDEQAVVVMVAGPTGLPGEHISLIVNLPSVDLVEQSHHHKGVKDGGEVLRWHRAAKLYRITMSISGLVRPYGLRSSSSSLGNSVAKARDARVSMIRLTQSIWIARSGVSCAVEGAKHGNGNSDHIDGQLELQELGNRIVHVAAPLDGLDNAGEVVVSQDDVGGLLGNVGALEAHSESDVGLLQSRTIVGAVSSYGDNLATSGDLRGDDAGHQATHDTRQTNLIESSLRHLASSGISNTLIKLLAFEHQEVFSGFQNAAFRSNGSSRVDIVSRHHSNADAGALALANSGRHLRSDRILDADYGDAGKLGHYEVLIVPVGLLFEGGVAGSRAGAGRYEVFVGDADYLVDGFFRHFSAIIVIVAAHRFDIAEQGAFGLVANLLWQLVSLLGGLRGV
uniref:CCHC-type domain-containing protein n=1 Tax=Macrostomum lignano TaxID=282301 RepID=A0A1I8IG43_9PLAT